MPNNDLKCLENTLENLISNLLEILRCRIFFSSQEMDFRWKSLFWGLSDLMPHVEISSDEWDAKRAANQNSIRKKKNCIPTAENDKSTKKTNSEK